MARRALSTLRFDAGTPHPQDLADSVGQVGDLESLHEESVATVVGGTLATPTTIVDAVAR